MSEINPRNNANNTFSSQTSIYASTRKELTFYNSQSIKKTEREPYISTSRNASATQHFVENSLTNPSASYNAIIMEDSSKIALADVVPLNDAMREKYNFSILLYFANFFKPATQKVKKKFFIFNRSIKKDINPYVNHLVKIDKLHIFDPSDHKITKDMISTIVTDDVCYLSLARASVLLRDSSHFLEHMPDSYKANLLQNYPENEKTQTNLTRSFKANMKKSYEKFMTMLIESQNKSYELSHDKTIQRQILTQIENLPHKLLDRHKDSITEEQLYKIEKYKDKIFNLLDTTDQKNLIEEYKKFRKKICEIMQDKNCLDKITNIKKTYKISYAKQWGMLELSVKETQYKVISVINSTQKIHKYIDKTTDFDTKEIKKSLKLILDKKDDFEKYIDDFQEISQDLERQLKLANAIAKEAKGNIPNALYKEITQGSIISIKEINKIIKDVSKMLEKSRKKVIDGMEACARTIASTHKKFV